MQIRKIREKYRTGIVSQPLQKTRKNPLFSRSGTLASLKWHIENLHVYGCQTNCRTFGISPSLGRQFFIKLRPEYALHFDEIKAAIDNPRNTLRTCAEDIMGLNPVIAEAISNEILFFQELHRAIKEDIRSADAKLCLTKKQPNK